MVYLWTESAGAGQFKAVSIIHVLLAGLLPLHGCRHGILLSRVGLVLMLVSSSLSLKAILVWTGLPLAPVTKEAFTCINQGHLGPKLLHSTILMTH